MAFNGTNGLFTDNTPFSQILTVCSKYNPPNHLFFQLANVFIFLSYMAPMGVYGLLYLRSCVTVGSLLFVLFGWVICSLDFIIWNLLFTLINAFYTIVIIYKLHPFIRFPHEVELVYRDLFQPLQVSRQNFRKIYRCMREIQTLKPHDVYCVEGITSVDKLSLLMSGRVAILKNGRTIHLIDSHQFLDSPEWFGVGSNETYQVTIMALEESRLMIWHRDKLKLSICTEPYLQAIIDNILGKDVVKKLLFVTESVSCNGSLHNVANNAMSEQSKLIVPIHRSMDQVVKRSLNAANNINSPYSFWSLTRINEEKDTETNV